MVKLKTAILIIGDIILLYLSLAITLIIRYGYENLPASFSVHFEPFSFIFLIWVIVFYLADLYQIRKMKRGPQLLRDLVGSIILSAAVSVIFIYILPKFFELTPKTNLAIFGLIFCVLDFAWRLGVVKSPYARTKIMILGESPVNNEIVSYIEANPQIGYDLARKIGNGSKEYDFEKLKNTIKDEKIDIVLIPPQFTEKESMEAKSVYRLLPLEVDILYATDFFEMIFQKIPLESLEESWFVEKINTRRNFYNALKRAIDILLGSALLIVLSPLMLLVAILTKLSPREGPAIFKQKRTGINNKKFTLFKFGTMRGDKGAAWTVENDDRITFLGKILRRSHLDEIPQLWNIVRGDISFIGPRAESSELTLKYNELPYYDIRHIIKPGLTGWAQINYRPSASLEEAFEKLKYDIYYIKNRSLILDLLIIAKTARLLFSNPK
ncbi:MAG: sugar transferase [Candidatus Wolfebacteria bacterium]|nr:sugar transferase [Candidatus Wolfebacteria bacterium]